MEWKITCFDGEYVHYVQPLFGVLLAALVLGESITAFTLLGTAFIIYGIYEAERKPIMKSEDRNLR
jgi:drug/metabolite transporter (DMT)-like permease